MIHIYYVENVKKNNMKNQNICQHIDDMGFYEIESLFIQFYKAKIGELETHLVSLIEVQSVKRDNWDNR